MGQGGGGGGPQEGKKEVKSRSLPNTFDDDCLRMGNQLYTLIKLVAFFVIL